jgi:hypothetical protein
VEIYGEYDSQRKLVAAFKGIWETVTDSRKANLDTTLLKMHADIFSESVLLLAYLSKQSKHNLHLFYSTCYRTGIEGHPQYSNNTLDVHRSCTKESIS